ncbi:hypothetical protein FB451DRAFT_1396139 [Mycena latifolia]|nr:hypothetical protein FB451DRAFT_1396139 [Mycena latifolia]
MNFAALLFISFIHVLHVFVAPLHRRDGLRCAVNDTTHLGADLIGVNFALERIDPSGLVDAAALSTAQDALRNATGVSNQIERAGFFVTLNPPTPPEMLDLLVTFLTDTQTKIASIAVSQCAPNSANNTEQLADATQSIGQAVDQAATLNCTAA